MKVEPSAAWIVDPSPPVIAFGEPGAGVGPLLGIAPDVGLG